MKVLFRRSGDTTAAWKEQTQCACGAYLEYDRDDVYPRGEVHAVRCPDCGAEADLIVPKDIAEYAKARHAKGSSA